MHYSSRISHFVQRSKITTNTQEFSMTKYFARKISSRLFQTGSLLQHGNRVFRSVFRSDSAHAQTGRDPPCLYACAFILTFMGVAVISEKGNGVSLTDRLCPDFTCILGSLTEITPFYCKRYTLNRSYVAAF